jgi:hypothetical protein
MDSISKEEWKKEEEGRNKFGAKISNDTFFFNRRHLKWTDHHPP